MTPLHLVDPFKLEDDNEDPYDYMLLSSKKAAPFTHRYGFHGSEADATSAQEVIERGNTPFRNTSEIYRHAVKREIEFILTIEQDPTAIRAYAVHMATNRIERRAAKVEANTELVETCRSTIRNAIDMHDIGTFELVLENMVGLMKDSQLEEPWRGQVVEMLDEHQPFWRGPDNYNDPGPGGKAATG